MAKFPTQKQQNEVWKFALELAMDTVDQSSSAFANRVRLMAQAFGCESVKSRSMRFLKGAGVTVKEAKR
jgi:hypothetical protein